MRLRSRRRGGTLVPLAAGLFIILLGCLALGVDVGLVYSTRAQMQMAVDAAALAATEAVGHDKTPASAAIELYRTNRGISPDQVSLTSESGIVTQYQAGSDQVTIKYPYDGDSNKVQVSSKQKMPLKFAAVLGIQQITIGAQAVSRFETVLANAAVIALDPNGAPGFSKTGNGNRTFRTPVWVNSTRTVAVALSGSGLVRAKEFHVVGEVDNPGIVHPLVDGNPSPLRVHEPPIPDPFAQLPPPSKLSDPVNVNTTVRSGVKISSGTVTLSPGVYQGDIYIRGGNVTFQPGIYILAGGSLDIGGNDPVTAHGVMFYITGNDYNANTGLPDKLDTPCENNPPPNSTGSKFGRIYFSGNGTRSFTPLNDPGSRFHGMLFYQRRANTNQMLITGNSHFTTGDGMIYGKWAPCTVTGNGNWDAMYVVRTWYTTGNGDAMVGPLSATGVSVKLGSRLIE